MMEEKQTKLDIVWTITISEGTGSKGSSSAAHSPAPFIAAMAACI